MNLLEILASEKPLSALGSVGGSAIGITTYMLSNNLPLAIVFTFITMAPIFGAVYYIAKSGQKRLYKHG
ncbi:MAG: hypothetical protein QW063_01610 [Candidatus Nanoarchaeia archaeon]